MKKIFLIAALFGMALTSCVKDELTEQSYEQTQIVFEAPVVSPTTKVVSEVPTSYDNSLAFGVWAKYYSGGSYVNDGFASAPNYMDNVMVKYTTTSQIWETYTKGTASEDDVREPYYWPKNGSLTFIAYSPYNVEGVGFSESGISFNDYIVDIDVTKQNDLLYSDRVLNKNSGVVDIVFKHALSSIRFAVKAGADYGKTDISISKIELLNVYSKASFNQGLTDNSISTTSSLIYTGPEGKLDTDENGNIKNFLWSNWGNQYAYTAFSSSNNVDPISLDSDSYIFTCTGTSDNPGNATDLILLPQLLEDVVLKVTYSITNPAGVSIEQVGELSLNTKAGYENIGDNEQHNRYNEAWARGKRYTYYITVGLDQITFSPSVEDWKDIHVPGPNSSNDNEI